jgi:hypothetical protein
MNIVLYKLQLSLIIAIVGLLRKQQPVTIGHHPLKHAVLQLRKDVEFLLQLSCQLVGGQVRLLDLSLESFEDNVFQKRLQECWNCLHFIITLKVEVQNCNFKVVPF